MSQNVIELKKRKPKNPHSSIFNTPGCSPVRNKLVCLLFVYLPVHTLYLNDIYCAFVCMNKATRE